MRINQIQPANYAFKAKRNDYVTKKMLEPRVKKLAKDIFIKNNGETLSPATVKELLNKMGITYCSVTGDTVHAAAGYNGGFFSVKFPTAESEDILKSNFVTTLLTLQKSAFGGLLNYKNMIGDLKRQDIVQKGLQLHTYELNPDISTEMTKYAAAKLSKLSKKAIKPEDLFYINSEAFYYDNVEKTAYSIDVSMKVYEKRNPTIRICRFNTDKKGNTIGYTTTAMDLFMRRPAETTYKEQLERSEVLPEIAESKNNKLYAEAFRFGNNEKFYLKKEDAIPNILKHLEERVGVSAPTKDSLQFVKLYDKQGNKLKRICYYDPTTGRSLVYNDEGKYMYQMEYNRDAFGNIIACCQY